MFTVENETVLHASRADVWAELTNFANYSLWNPFIRIEGSVANRGNIQYSFRNSSKRTYFYTVNARVLQFEVARSMAFGVGFRSLLAIEEGYHLAPATDGVRLVHSFRCTGLFSALKLNKMKRNFAKMLEIMDKRFQQHLRERRSASLKRPFNRVARRKR